MHGAHPPRWTRCLAAVLALTLVLDAVSLLGVSHTASIPTAMAAFPGGNGRITFDSNRVVAQNPEGDFEIFTMQPDGSDVSQLTSNTTDDIAPAWSADGQQIAFQSQRDGNWEIYTMLADGSGQTNRTNNALGDESPTWSPDGKRIAFQRQLSFNDTEIFVMNDGGGGQTNLTNSPGLDGFPSWRPDGAFIVFESTRTGTPGSPDIYSMGAVAGDFPRRIGPGRGPDYAPNGTNKIVFYQQVGNQLDIFVMTESGGSAVNLTNSPASEYEPVWSPDGEQIAFTRDHDDHSEIVTMAHTGADPVTRSGHGAIDEAPSWQPQPKPKLPGRVIGPPKFNRGDVIIFTSNQGTPFINLFTLELGPFGDHLSQLTFDTNENYTHPTWSPDGSQIVVVSRGTLYTMNANGTNEVQLTTGIGGLEPSLSWSPDGTQIVFDSTHEGPIQLYLIGADGSNLTKLTNSLAGDTNPDWSPDGKIAFERNCPGQSRRCLFTINPNGTGLSQLTFPEQGNSDDPAWSPDGTQIAFSHNDDAISTMSVDGTQQRDVVQGIQVPRDPSWSPDGRQIVFDGGVNLYTVKANGTNLTQRTNNASPTQNNYPDWSPNPSQGQAAAAQAHNDRRGANANKKQDQKQGKRQSKHKKKHGPHAGKRHGDGHRNNNHRHRGDERRDGNAESNEHRNTHGNGSKAKRGHGDGREGAGARHRH